MKIILFNSKNQVLDILLSDDIEIQGDSISFSGNRLTGIRANYIIVNNEDTDVQIGDTIPELLKEKDQKEKYVKREKGDVLEEDVNRLKEETVNQMTAIADIYELLLGEGSVK